MRAATGTSRVIAGRYHLQAPIGRGAMGIVWRGRDELLHRDVAVKEVQVNALAMAVGTQIRYEPALREARAAARLSHPSVVTVFDIVEEQGHPWIVMELVPGRSLDQVIAEDGPLPPQQAAELGTSLLGALAAAHAAGVLHRDVKPGNVLVTADGRAVLTDFGIATFEEDPSLTQAGMVVGTPGFTAPERVRGHSATPASDLWSLGATLYAAVEGRGPFDRAGGAAAISAGVAVEDAPRAPSAGPLGPVIDALLRRDPAARPDAATAATLLTDAGSTAGSGPWPLLGHGWPGARQSSDGSADSPTTALPADPGPAGRSAEPSFLDPPVFADLRMPGPGDHAGPAREVTGRDTAGRDGADRAGRDRAGRDGAGRDEPGQRGTGQAGQSGAGQAGGLPGFLDPPVAGGRARLSAGPVPAGPARAWRAGPASGASRRGPWSRYWRVATVSAGIAAIVVAAFLGSTIYSRTLTAGSDGGQAGGARAAGPAVAAGQASASSGPVSGAGAQPGGAGAAGHGPAQGAATSGSGTGTDGRTGTGGSPGTGSSGTGSSGTGGSGAGGAGTAGAPPPAGYQWHTVAAASLGTTAGLVIAAPAAWQLRTQGQNVFLDPPGGRAQIEISLNPFSYERPVREARDQQAAALAADKYPGYRKIAIEPADFLGTAAASWRFSWKPASTARTTVLAILVTLPTSAGDQPYALSVSAPSASFAAARPVFEKALSTFRPLPPG
jgi:tRNA A-37 threonylcarbamoyl transferase component Bud32